MLRALLGLLLLANLVFFGWARGWFAPAWPAPGAAEREPARLAAQVAPERISLLAPAAASAALLATKRDMACLPLGAAEGAQAAASAPPPAASQAGGELKPCAPVR
jgi:hypothetical protein